MFSPFDHEQIETIFYQPLGLVESPVVKELQAIRASFILQERNLKELANSK